MLSGHWPTQSSDLAPYNIRTIFDWSRDFVVGAPSQVQNGVVLNSMKAMVDMGIVDHDLEKVVVEAAGQVWVHNPEFASPILLVSNPTFVPSDVATLGLNADGSNEGAVNLLVQIWDKYASGWDGQKTTVLAKTLLSSEM